MSGTGLAFAREKALKAASGEYLFFLDSDDELSPKCVEKVVSAMDETCADTAVYSAWVQTGQLGFACFCDADPKRGKLLLNKGDNRVGSTLCYSGAGLWTRACRRSFLEENGIGFDESRPNHITDPIFNFEVALSAERTVVLSSLVGYIYHYGIGMLLSDRKQAADDILSLCETYISDYKKRGLAADNLIWFFLRLYLFLAEGQKEDTSKMEGFCRAKGIAGVLAPPKMDWVYLQNGADRIYAEVMKRIG